MSILKELGSKPWERKGVIGGLEPEGTFDAPSQKVALIFFLVVASVLFSLFTISYFIRMELPDWTPISDPALLWVNTGFLVFSSVLFQWSRNISKAGESKNLLPAFAAGGVFAIIFIAGQIVTWGNLQDAGLYLTSNPANSFFYLMTGLHALHLLGGLWVWSISTIRLISGTDAKELKLSIELCTLYWHFLLVVWLGMFAVLANT